MKQQQQRLVKCTNYVETDSVIDVSACPHGHHQFVKGQGTTVFHRAEVVQATVVQPWSPFRPTTSLTIYGMPVNHSDNIPAGYLWLIGGNLWVNDQDERRLQDIFLSGSWGTTPKDIAALAAGLREKWLNTHGDPSHSTSAPLPWIVQPTPAKRKSLIGRNPNSTR